MQQLGPGNPMVTLTQIRNTIADMLALSGVRNSTRYFNPMNPQIEQQMMQQQAQQAQAQQGPPPDPQAQAFLQAEQMKTQAKMQSDMAKLQTQNQREQFKLQLDAQKAAMADDLERDKMDQDLLVSAAEILGKYGTALDVERVKQMQDMPR